MHFYTERITLHSIHTSVRYGPLHTEDWGTVTIEIQALSLVEKANLVQVHFTIRLRDQWSMWMQDGYQVNMDSYMESNGSCVMVTWTMFKNYLLEVGLTQLHEIMAFRILITVDFSYFIMCEALAWIEIHWNSIWLRAQSHMTLNCTWGPMSTPHDFGSVLGQPLNTSYGLPQFHGYNSRLVCEVVLSNKKLLAYILCFYWSVVNYELLRNWEIMIRRGL